MSRQDMGPDLPLYQNVNLMLFDAQYTLSEIVEKIDWGHAAAPIGLDVAMRVGIKKMLFMHHDPFALDDKIALAEKQTRDYYNMRLKSSQDSMDRIHHVEWSFAQEGMIVDV